MSSGQQEGGEINRYAEINVVCSTCNATKGAPCTTKGGNNAIQVHAERFYAARKMWRLDAIKARSNR